MNKPFIFLWNDYIKSIPTRNSTNNPTLQPKDTHNMSMSSKAKRCAIALGTYADNLTGYCWPNRTSLIDDCGLTRSDLKGIDELIHKGIVLREEKRLSNGAVSYGYKLILKIEPRF